MTYRIDSHMLIQHNTGFGSLHGKTAFPISAKVADLLVENGYAVLDARLALFDPNAVTHYYRAAGHDPVFENDYRNVDRPVETVEVTINGEKYTLTGHNASKVSTALTITQA